MSDQTIAACIFLTALTCTAFAIRARQQELMRQLEKPYPAPMFQGKRHSLLRKTGDKSDQD
ncbi:MAG: hypothetical protein K2W95_04850 [Candidatus Obscuribacterales bacterium]|nr:hypothetical protein [Candidatus Obscuribacterales bacterium]